MNSETKPHQPLKKHPDPVIDALFELMDYRFDKSRKLVVTPYIGNYGRIAGHVIVINGSPPKATLIVPTMGDGVPMILYSCGKVATIFGVFHL